MKGAISSEKSKQASLDRDARNALKLELMSIGAVFVPKYGMRPVCAVCGEAILQSPDMHEALVSKGYGRHLPSSVLNCRGNCVLLHPGGKASTCHSEAHTMNGYIKCAMFIYKRDGLSLPLEFLTKVRDLSKSKRDIGPALKFTSVLVENGVEQIEIETMLRSAGW